jgi:myo-inositol 2-dehydrogenase / D-chiro-inositol 1-dehydrogenase
VHCTHRNPMVADHFTSEFMIRDCVVHEVDVARFLLDEEIASVQVVRGAATSRAPEGVADPMLVIFETESGRIVTDEVYVRSQIGYEVRTEVVGEQGVATIGLDQNLLLKSADGRWGGAIAPGFVQRFGTAYDIELQRWVDAARAGTIDGPGAWDGYAAVAVCEAGVEAVRTGAKVAVHLDPRPDPARPAPVEEPAPGITAPDLEAARP